jgi:glyoxylase-like metal-dependent hydrolase (beta-lactamase superfamily II)
MFKLAIGDITVETIEEVSGPRYTPAFLLPKASSELIQRHAGWMAPDLYDPQADLLAMVRQSMVVRTRHHAILIDTCVGDCKRRNPPGMNDLHSPWLGNFRALGLSFEDIDLVMCTHLHVDHVGWNTRLADGRWVPTFPNARYIFARSEYEFWKEARQRGKDSPDGPVFEDSVEPVVEAGLAQIVDDAEELSDGFRLEPTAGHSVGHVAIHLEAAAGHVIFSGDVMHHPIQVREPHINSCFCEYPDRSAATRRRFLETYADRDVLVAPAHFERGTVGRITSGPDGFNFDFLQGGSTR